MSREYTPQYVAESFVKQYYEILSNSPGDLYKFYLQDAIFSHNEAFNENETCVGAEQIRQKVARLNLHGTVIDLSKGSIDAQKVADNRILVVVNGAYSAPSQASRFFMNTFLLVGMNHAYFVSNSVFRMLHSQTIISAQPPPLLPQLVEVVPVAPSTSQLSQRNATEILKSVIEVSQTVSAPVTEVAQAATIPPNEPEENEDPVEIENVQDTQEEEEPQEDDPVPSYDDVVEEGNEVEDSADTKAQDLDPLAGGTKSYLDIVKKLALQNQNSAEKSATPQPFRVVRSSSQAATESTNKPTTVSNPSPPQLYSVYVNFLPDNVTEEELANIFQIFGRVVQVDLTRGRKYGFVKFDTVEAMQAALDYKEPLELRGIVLQVEEKTSPKSKFDGKRKDREKDKKRIEKSDKGEKSPRSQKVGDFRRQKKDNLEKDKPNARGNHLVGTNNSNEIVSKTLKK